MLNEDLVERDQKIVSDRIKISGGEISANIPSFDDLVKSEDIKSIQVRYEDVVNIFSGNTAEIYNQLEIGGTLLKEQIDVIKQLDFIKPDPRQAKLTTVAEALNTKLYDYLDFVIMDQNITFTIQQYNKINLDDELKDEYTKLLIIRTQNNELRQLLILINEILKDKNVI